MKYCYNLKLVILSLSQCTYSILNSTQFLLLYVYRNRMLYLLLQLLEQLIILVLLSEV
jgi:hypothetical protein